MNMKKDRNKKAIYLAILVVGMLWASMAFTIFSSDITNKNMHEKVDTDDNIEWHKIATITPDNIGDYDPGAGSSGWIETFCLDYGQDPDTVLANNATDWSGEATARGYVDGDGETIDLASEDPFYFVVGCRFNDDAKDGDTWNWSRFRVNLTVSGDETISAVGEYDNSSTNGDFVVSDTQSDMLWGFFYWDDGDDGYRITDDGNINWAITIYAKY